jgi:hypothetical protein
MKRKLFAPLLVMAILTFSCGSGSLPNVPDPSGVETIVAATLQSLTPVVSVPAVPTYQYENVSLTIPNDLGTGAIPTTTDEVELPFINPSNGPMPQHIVLEINGYPLARNSRIMVFKAAEYSAYSEITQQTISTLQSLQYQAGQPLPDELSVGPFNAQAQSLSFQNGHGLRYITEVLTAVLPISNDQIFYYYQGLTNDGAYYISAILPISAPFLISEGNPDSSLPVDGIPFPNSSNAQDFDSYYAAITEKLNTADAGIFKPSLSTLDTLIQSIAIQ